MIICIDQTHARKIQNLLYSQTGEKATIVISEDKFASEKIKIFRDSYDKWIIAVKMISEGVDIPRLRVGAYATNVTRDLTFRQIVGRFVRLIPGIENSDAYLYIPADLT